MKVLNWTARAASSKNEQS